MIPPGKRHSVRLCATFVRAVSVPGRYGAVWTILAERMKAGREHRVPLSPRALEVLDGAAEFFDGQRLVFPSSARHVLNVEGKDGGHGSHPIAQAAATHSRVARVPAPRS